VNASFSIRGYLSSAPCNDQLVKAVKHTDFCVSASSRIKAELTVKGETAK